MILLRQSDITVEPLSPSECMEQTSDECTGIGTHYVSADLRACGQTVALIERACEPCAKEFVEHLRSSLPPGEDE